MKKMIDKWLEKVNEAERIELESMNESEQKESFCSLFFGTSGVRAKMGIGSGKLNKYTVSLVACAAANYFKQFFNKNGAVSPKLIITRDSRINGELFAKITASIFVQKGFTVEVFKQPTPVPVLSYATKYMGYNLGIAITASHNAKEYNGLKFFYNGGLISDEMAASITQNINELDEFICYNNLVVGGYKKVNQRLEKQYVTSLGKFEIMPNIKIVYSPLNGTGAKIVKKQLNKYKVKYYIPKAQEKIDGNFSTCKFPNPENESAFAECLKLATDVDADILFATDPDADRLGVMAKHDGAFEILSGNEIGILLACDIIDKNSTPNSFIVTTEVSSKAIEIYARQHNVKTYRTLIGFKNIFEEIGKNTGENFIFAFEEANGYIANNFMRDKDGIYAGLKIIEIASKLKSQNKSVFDRLNEIYSNTYFEYGKSQSIKIEVAEPTLEMQKIMSKIRKEKIFEIETDFYTDKTSYKKSNFIKVKNNNDYFYIRPSGTEPKIKIYYYATGDSRLEAKNNYNKNIKIIIDKINNLINQ